MRSNVLVTIQDPFAKAATLQALAVDGIAIFHVRRDDASLRRMQYLAPQTPERKAAEKVEVLRAEGLTIKAVAAKMHVSVPTVRRMINNLELSQAVEDGEFNHALELLEG